MGTGYVGLTTGTCFAELGNDVIGVDIDEKKINDLKQGIIPIYEPGLKELVDRNTKEKRLLFTTDVEHAIEHAEIIFIAVGTPSDKEGKADLSYVMNAAKDIGTYMKSYKVVINKSTVPVGTAEKVKEAIAAAQPSPLEFDVVSNPEFLREGQAIKDFMAPDRIVIGVESPKAKEMMIALYKGLERMDKPIVITDVKSAEIIKYASNAMLACRIAFMNQLSELCEVVGADIKEIAKGVGLDHRIGPRFLQAGVGYGGSCFPKDVKALIHTLKENNCHDDLIESIDKINERQKLILIPKIQHLLGKTLTGKKIAIWGLAFKPKTSDMRDAPSISIIKELQKLGASISAFDPIAREEAKKVLTNVVYTETSYEAVKGADALILVTEWNEFRNVDFEAVKALMKQPYIFDGRNIYDPAEMREHGFTYVGIGR